MLGIEDGKVAEIAKPIVYTPLSACHCAFLVLANL